MIIKIRRKKTGIFKQVTINKKGLYYNDHYHVDERTWYNDHDHFNEITDGLLTIKQISMSNQISIKTITEFSMVSQVTIKQ